MAPGAKGQADAAAELPPALEVLEDGDEAFAARYAATKRLGGALSSGEIDRVMALLDDRTLNEAIRNDLLVALEEQARPVGDLASLLITHWRDSSHSPTWRDYCLQHMAEVHAIEPAHRERLVKTLAEAASGDGAHAETAMLSLERISERDESIRPILSAAAQSAVENRAQDPEKAVTALQIASDMGSGEALAAARKIAADATQPSRLRMSAVATLASSAKAEDRAILRKLTGDADSRVRRAARLNLKD
jgi:hypothetical protein